MAKTASQPTPMPTAHRIARSRWAKEAKDAASDTYSPSSVTRCYGRLPIQRLPEVTSKGTAT
ncbi:hypothetical protein GCM10009687_63180 [Asanoa iriomotensis]|uniref:Uncharacterized protein n=1 Tax=Asanoa iriomotensis TaxID=234613 RepID=A0ABQ4C5F3_9ACTN|nr:hypothetical protein Air01nite_37360 [Asanoa iriomotensis]